MIFEIDKSTKVSAIQHQFSTYYPFLKLSFLTNKRSHKNNNSGLHKSGTEICVSDLSSHIKPMFLELHYWQKTGTVERLFQEKTGIHIQVLRRHNAHWIETSGTDDLTLEEQNNIGRKSVEESLHGSNHSVEMEKPI